MDVEDVGGKHGALSFPPSDALLEQGQLILLAASAKTHRDWYQLNMNFVYAEICV